MNIKYQGPVQASTLLPHQLQYCRQKLTLQGTDSGMRDVLEIAESHYDLHSVTLYLAICDDKIVGWLMRSELSCPMVYVHPTYRRMGIGRTLVDMLRKELAVIKPAAGYTYLGYRTRGVGWTDEARSFWISVDGCCN